MKSKAAARLQRRTRIRKKVRGSAACPRLSVFRSLEHLHAQLIDDDQRATLFGLSTQSGEFKGPGGNVKGAKQFGKIFGQQATQKKFSKVVFDRGGFLHHGRVKAFAEGAREGGLQF